MLGCYLETFYGNIFFLLKPTKINIQQNKQIKIWVVRYCFRRFIPQMYVYIEGKIIVTE